MSDIPPTANVVIIGAGALGTSAAFHLAEAGVQDILLLDKGPVGEGTTQFAAGQTGHLRTDRMSVEFSMYCMDFFESFGERSGYPVDFNQHGSLRIALTDAYVKDLQERHAAALEYGLDATFISIDEACRMVPTMQLDEAAGILFAPRDGFVEPRSVALAYAAGARDRGVQVLEGVAVDGIEIAEGRIHGVRTDKGEISAPTVVLAAGAWTRKLGREAGIDVPSVPVRHQLYVTAPLPGVLDDQPIVRLTEPQLYIRQHNGGLLVGGYGYRPMSFDMNDFPGSFQIPDLEVDRIYYEEMDEVAHGFFPALQDAEIVEERRGLPTMAPDAKHVISAWNGVEGLILATACSVGGVHHSPGIGRIVAGIVTGNDDWPPAAGLRADRFDEAGFEDADLRQRCEQAYAVMYRGVL